MDLTFEGFVGLADPVAPGVQGPSRCSAGAGLRTVMITGDQRATAEAVGRAVGLIDGPARIIEGRELSAMTAASSKPALPTFTCSAASRRSTSC